MDGAVDAHSERVDQGLTRLGRAHRDRDGLEPQAIFEVDRLCERAQVVRADYVDPVAPDSARHGIEVGDLNERNLFDTNRDLRQRNSPRGTNANEGCRWMQTGVPQTRVLNPAATIG